MAARPYYVTEALVSFRRLCGVMAEMNLEEVHAALELESGTHRRQSVTAKLVDRAVQLESQNTRKRLQEKYQNGKNT